MLTKIWIKNIIISVFSINSQLIAQDMNRITISKFLIIMNLLLIFALTQPACQIQDLNLNLFACRLQYCQFQDNTILIKSCTSSSYSTQYAEDQTILYSGSFGSCIRQCCVRGDNPLAPLTSQFLYQCEQLNNQSYTFEVLRNIAFFAFIFFFSLIVCCRIWKCLKLRSLQPGTCQNKFRGCLLKYCCCCLNQGVQVRPQNGQSHQGEIPSLQAFNFNTNQISSGQQLFKERDSLFDINDRECAICLENLPNSVTACGHRFHTNCIRQWIKRDWHCPLCKTQRITPIRVYCNVCFAKYVTLEGRSQVLNQNLKFFTDKVCISCGHGKNFVELTKLQSGEKNSIIQ